MSLSLKSVKCLLMLLRAKRIAVIILKLIQARLIENVTGIKPIMLFDDIFAGVGLFIHNK